MSAHRRAGACGRGTAGGAEELAVGAGEQLGVVAVSRNLDGCAARRDADHGGVVAEPLDLAGKGWAVLLQVVGANNFVAEEERALRPDEDVADPVPVAAAPFRAKAVDLSAGDTDGAAKRAGLALDPALARKNERGKRHQDDEIDAEYGEQRDQHGSLLFRSPAWRSRPGARFRSGARSCRRTKRAGCRGAGSGTSPCLPSSGSSSPPGCPRVARDRT